MANDMAFGKAVIIIATLTAWLFLVLGSLHYVIRSIPQDNFVELATKIILPLYNATIVAALSFAFGKPVVSAFAKRISPSADSPRNQFSSGG